MKKVDKEFLDNGKKLREDTKKYWQLYQIQKSYLSKEEFIKMIEMIDFVGIKKAYIELLTGVIYKDDETKALSKTIDIN